MDKYEYKLKLDEVEDLVSGGDYAAAAGQCDSVNWNKVRNANTLCSVGAIYEKAGRTKTARQMYQLANKRSPGSRNALYHLTKLSLELGDTAGAEDYYNEFIRVAPRDPVRYVLEYQIACVKSRPLKERIAILEDLKKREYTEEWAYELAYLYYQAGMADHCVATCDELALWFGDGEYVRKALELKKYFRPLTASQEEQYRKILQDEEEARRAREEAERKAREEAEKAARRKAEETRLAEEAERKAREEAARQKAEKEAEEARLAEEAEQEAREKSARQETEKDAEEPIQSEESEQVSRKEAEGAERKAGRENEQPDSEAESFLEVPETEIIENPGQTEVFSDEDAEEAPAKDDAETASKAAGADSESADTDTKEKTSDSITAESEISNGIKEPEPEVAEAEIIEEVPETEAETESVEKVSEAEAAREEVLETETEPAEDASETETVPEGRTAIEPETVEAEVVEDIPGTEAASDAVTESVKETEETVQEPEVIEEAEEPSGFFYEEVEIDSSAMPQEADVYEESVEIPVDTETPAEELRDTDDLEDIEEMPEFLKREVNTSSDTFKTARFEDFREVPFESSEETGKESAGDEVSKAEEPPAVIKEEAVTDKEVWEEPNVPEEPETSESDDNAEAEVTAETTEEEAEAVEPVKSTEEEVEAVEAEPAEPTEKAAEAEPAEPTEEAAEAEPAEPTEEAVEAAEAESTEEAAEAEPAEPTEEAAEAEPAESTEEAVEAEPAEPTEEAAEAEPAESTEEAAEAEPAEPIEEAVEAEPAEPTEEAAEAEPAELTEEAVEGELTESTGKEVEATKSEKSAEDETVQEEESAEGTVTEDFSDADFEAIEKIPADADSENKGTIKEEVAYEEEQVPLENAEDEEKRVSGFNAANLESHLEKNIRKIESAQESGTIRAAMDSIHRMIDGVPYLEAGEDGRTEKPEEKKQNMQDTLRERLRENGLKTDTGAAGAAEEKTDSNSPASVEQFLEDWEKTKKAMEETIALAQHSQLEQERNQALTKANDIMIRLQEIIPDLQREIVPEKADVIREMDEKNLTGSAPDTKPVREAKTASVEQISPIATIVRGDAVERTLEEAKAEAVPGDGSKLEVLIDESHVKEEEEKRKREETAAKRAAAKEQSQQLEEHLRKAEQIMSENSTFKIAVEKVTKEEEEKEGETLPENLSDLGDFSDWEENPAKTDADTTDPAEPDEEEKPIREVQADFGKPKSLEEQVPEETPVSEEQTEPAEQNTAAEADGEEKPIREVYVDFGEPKTAAEKVPEDKPAAEKLAEPAKQKVAAEEISEEAPVSEEQAESVEQNSTEEADEDGKPVREVQADFEESEPAAEADPVKEPANEAIANDAGQQPVPEKVPEETPVREVSADIPQNMTQASTMEEFSEKSADSIADFYEDAVGAEDISDEEEIPSVVLYPEEIRSFKYFISVPGMEIQITDAVSGVCYRTKGARNSVTGNILIMGEEGSGKTYLATKLIRVIQQKTGRKDGKIGKISAVSLNRRDFASLAAKVAGGFLIVEHAGALTRETAIRMSQIMEQNTGGLVIVLEDTSIGIHEAMNLDRNFSRKFTESIRIPIFNVDELVDFARSYAAEKEASIDEMGRLALFNRIEKIQKVDHATRLEEVKDIVDGAIRKAENAGLKKKFGSGRSRKYNEGNRLILHEQDFEE